MHDGISANRKNAPHGVNEFNSDAMFVACRYHLNGGPREPLTVCKEEIKCFDLDSHTIVYK